MEPHPQEEVERVTCALEGHVGAVNALALWGPYVASAGGDAMVGGAWIGRADSRGKHAVRCQCWKRCHGRTGL